MRVVCFSEKNKQSAHDEDGRIRPEKGQGWFEKPFARYARCEWLIKDIVEMPINDNTRERLILLVRACNGEEAATYYTESYFLKHFLERREVQQRHLKVRPLERTGVRNFEHWQRAGLVVASFGRS